MICEIDGAILQGRAENVKRMLRPLIDKQNPLAVEIVERQPVLTMAALSGRRLLSHYSDWRFNTYVRGIRAGYYERWSPTDNTRRRYYFVRGYLHVFRTLGAFRDATEEQVLALHCDPNEPRGEPHARYKQGPHLHISAAGSPINESHLALNHSHLDEVLSSFESLCAAWDDSIKLVRDEILALYQ
jgi:hypothetical protein